MQLQGYKEAEELVFWERVDRTSWFCWVDTSTTPLEMMQLSVFQGHRGPRGLSWSHFGWRTFKETCTYISDTTSSTGAAARSPPPRKHHKSSVFSIVRGHVVFKRFTLSSKRQRMCSSNREGSMCFICYSDCVWVEVSPNDDLGKRFHCGAANVQQLPSLGFLKSEIECDYICTHQLHYHQQKKIIETLHYIEVPWHLVWLLAIHVSRL